MSKTATLTPPAGMILVGGWVTPTDYARPILRRR
jgi:hypothetical protein